MTVSLVGALLVLGSAAAYSGLDLTRKLLVRRMPPAALLFYLSIGQLPFFLAWMALTGSGRVSEGYFLPAAISVILNIAANLLFMEAVRVSPLSLTVPFLALTPVFTTLLGIPLLGETPGAVQWTGVAIVVVGALQLNLGAASALTPRGAWRAFLSEPGSLMMVFVSLCWSLAMPLDKLALGHADVAIHGVVLNAGVAGGVLAFIVLRRQWRDLRTVERGPGLLVVAILVSVLGLALLLLSLGFLWVAVVETLRRAIGSIAALVVGRWVFGEQITVPKLLGVGLMSIGVALILL
jgi:drug/metabolite transporter (DMT)-like permease